MIRRTLKSGLLAAVAVLVLLPTAAGATAAEATALRPAPGAVSQYDAHHHRGYTEYRFHLRRHHAHRLYRTGRFAHRGAAYRFAPRTITFRITTGAAPYRLQYRLAGERVTYRLVTPATGRVATRHARLNVRSGPGTGYRVIGHRRPGRILGLTCKTLGSAVHGDRIWYRLRHHAGYVSAHYVRAGRALPWC
ncbi:hypothetical protein [Streptomyces sp. NPDC046759]|uniref:hypothetical protein n=1 Tax=Streptomyces sp. NPDC046759 TaxID=3155019 RepID=UPI0033C4A52D